MSRVKEITDDDFKAKVLKSEVPVLVDFWAPWCGPCRMVSPVVEAIAEKTNGRLEVFKMNTDENMETVAAYRIMAIPTLMVFHKGEEAERIIGFKPEKDIVEILAKYVEKKEE